MNAHTCGPTRCLQWLASSRPRPARRRLRAWRDPRSPDQFPHGGPAGVRTKATNQTISGHESKGEEDTGERSKAQAQAQADASHEHNDSNDMPLHEFDIDPKEREIRTAVGTMPLSPIMDPTFWEAKQRFKKAKPKPGQARDESKKEGNNSVERQFRKNPYAMALATPMRQCGMTKVRLPNFFLQDFNLLLHPVTQQPWWVPRTLLLQQGIADIPDGAATHTANGEGSTTTGRIPKTVADVLADPVDVLLKQFESQQGPDEGDGSANDLDPFAMTTATTKTKRADNLEPLLDRPAAPPVAQNLPTMSPEGQLPNGPSAYLLARRDLVRAVGVPKSGFHERRLPGASSSRYRPSSNTAWRVDMDSVVLDLMRRGILADLIYLARLSVEDERHYIVRCFGWDDVQYKHRGSVLWFDHPKPEGASPKDVKAAVKEPPEPGPFATFDIESVTFIVNDPKKESVAVHNLPRLLGKEYTERLKRESKPFNEGGEIFMLAGRRTREVQKKLWKLQGYMCDWHGRPMWE
ncbi:uncharacterized protein B0I36DRAFT_320221 [Microdochium trichocladiopsis]|uniref:Uncharacterized protein n=1 Tax=Microdochium trichocladiopsis TaxID=1682393 RepID=A0A9P9BRG2_9PEZI|nr:uncharacterized protein B0I36DRAFT_320221 [Microdochium trichocladiopsis]KAH7032876.1 hypothetical protein B0I36DRAFT_320221 [Microdochium trichocladiopsis]